MRSFLILMLTCMVVVAVMETEAEEAGSEGHHRVARSPYHFLYGRVRNQLIIVIHILINEMCCRIQI
jgi:hypothetical protein